MFPLKRTWARRLPWLRRQMLVESPAEYDAVLYVKLGDWLEVQEEERSGVKFSVSGLIVLLLCCCCFSMAQDRLQVTVGYVVSEIKNPIEAVQNARTLSVDGKINIVRRSGWTFGPAFNYQRAYDVEVFPKSAIYPDGLRRDVDIFFGGAELAKAAGLLRFGGGFFLGTRKLAADMPRELVRKYRGFVEVATGHFVFRPFFAEAEVIGGFNANRIHRYGASAGVRF